MHHIKYKYATKNKFKYLYSYIYDKILKEKCIKKCKYSSYKYIYNKKFYFYNILDQLSFIYLLESKNGLFN